MADFQIDDRYETDGSLARAYDLASAGAVATFEELVRKLRREGFPTVLTDLRGVLVRRDLRRLIGRARSR